MASEFDEYAPSHLPGAFILDDFDDKNILNFDQQDLLPLDDLAGCFPLDTPSSDFFEGQTLTPSGSSNFFEDLSWTPSGSSAYGGGGWEILTPEEVLESQVNVKSKKRVQDAGLKNSNGATVGATGLSENGPGLGTESTWDLGMNPVKSRKNRPKTKKQRAAASFVRKYGACSVHKKAKKSCTCNLPAILRPIAVDPRPETSEIDQEKKAAQNPTPESMSPSSPAEASEHTNPKATDPPTHPSHLRKNLLIRRVLSMLLLALNALPTDEPLNPSHPDSASTLSLIHQTATAMGLPPETFSHLENIAQSALTNSLVYFCPYVFTGCSFATGDLDAFSLHTSNHPLDFMLGWDLLPFANPSASTAVYKLLDISTNGCLDTLQVHQFEQSYGVRYRRDSSSIYRQGDAAIMYGGQEKYPIMRDELDGGPFPDDDVDAAVQLEHLDSAQASSTHTPPSTADKTCPTHNIYQHPEESRTYLALFSLLLSLIWDTATSFISILPLFFISISLKYTLLTISRTLAIQRYIFPLHGASVSLGGV